MKCDTIHLVINGKQCALEGQPSVAEYLASKGFKPTQVVVEHNGKVLERGSLAETRLAAGDQVEVIVPVAGG